MEKFAILQVVMKLSWLDSKNITQTVLIEKMILVNVEDAMQLIEQCNVGVRALTQWLNARSVSTLQIVDTRWDY